MQRLSLAVVGVLMIAVGVVWTLQGTDVVGGSSMSGHHVWAVVGVILIVAGLAVVAAGARPRRPDRP